MVADGEPVETAEQQSKKAAKKQAKEAAKAAKVCYHWKRILVKIILKAVGDTLSVAYVYAYVFATSG